MRKLTALALSTVVVLGALGVGPAATLGDGTSSATAQAGNQSTISVSATGQASAEPDRAVVHLAVTARAENASDATNQLASDVERLRSAIEGSNLSVESVRTSDFRVSEQREDEREGGEPTEPRGFVASHSFVVTLTNTSQAGALIDLAVANGVTEIDGVRFTLSNARRAELRERAIDSAVSDARAQAVALANSTDLTITGIRSASTDAGHVGPVVEESADAGTSIDAGPVTVSASVQITYNATRGASGGPDEPIDATQD